MTEHRTIGAPGRAQRQKLIAEIIRSGPVASQEEVTARLAERGLAVTQATVSRDLDQLGAVKVKSGGALRYTLPGEAASSDWSAARLERILSDWVQSVEVAGNLLIVRTPPGSAHVVAHAFDQAKLPEIAGTIAGDDTLFIAVRDGVVTEAVAGQLRGMAGAPRATN